MNSHFLMLYSHCITQNVKNIGKSLQNKFTFQKSTKIHGLLCFTNAVKYFFPVAKGFVQISWPRLHNFTFVILSIKQVSTK